MLSCVGADSIDNVDRRVDAQIGQIFEENVNSLRLKTVGVKLPAISNFTYLRRESEGDFCQVTILSHIMGGCMSK